MLTNLFSMFDSNFYSLNPFFLQIFLIMLLLQSKISYFKNNLSLFISNKLIINIINKEFSNDIITFFDKKKKIFNMGATKMFYTIFISFFLLNMSSLFPMIFSSSSHISMNMPISLILWMAVILISIKVSWKNFFSHLTPKGTPIALMSFMVLIESISMLIRPITLSVRLMANMVAGHLLLFLLSNFSLLSMMNNFLSIPIMLILGLLEMGVSFIQSYVFTLLMILYFKESF